MNTCNLYNNLLLKLLEICKVKLDSIFKTNNSIYFMNIRKLGNQGL